MPKHESLDELIAQKASEFADQIKAAAAMADKEEEIRIETEKQLAFIQKDAGVKLEGRHEFTVASVVRQADCTLCRAARPRLTFSRMSEAVAVQMKGVGCSLCWAM